jgi:hypothetical protein
MNPFHQKLKTQRMKKYFPNPDTQECVGHTVSIQGMNEWLNEWKQDRYSRGDGRLHQRCSVGNLLFISHQFSKE